MTKRARPAWLRDLKPANLRYFYSHTALITLAGSVGLSVLSVDSWRAELRDWVPAALWSWGSSNKFLVVIVLVLLTLLPGVISQGYRRIRQVEVDVKKNLELSTAAASFSSRVAHLITKAGDVRAGEIDDAYLAHTLNQACRNLKERAIKVTGVDTDERVEAVLYRANSSNGQRFYERHRQTHTDVAEFDFKLTGHRNSAGKQLIADLSAQDYIFAADAESVARIHVALAIDEPKQKFQEYLAVPVCLNRKSTGDDRVWGMLLIMGTAANMIRETDWRLLQTYAWFLAAALALDTQERTARSSSQVVA